MSWPLFFQIFILMGWGGLLIGGLLNKPAQKKPSTIQRVSK